MTDDLIEAVYDLLEFDEDTGDMFWKERPAWMFPSDLAAHRWNAKYSGKKAGSARRDGYVCITINYQRILAHRIAWLFYYGAWPKNQIDHIDGNPQNNAKHNLRDVLQAINTRNQKLYKTNKSGASGVRYRASSGSWTARIRKYGKIVHLGTFKSFEEAKDARKKAEQTLGFHPNHGRVA